MRFLVLLLPVILISQDLLSQEKTDSAKTLDEVVVRAFEQNRKAGNSVMAIRFIQRNNSDRSTKTSLVNEFNTIAGVRMEERSPGSYRINIRGSSLRSPFGVRNVKVYWNDIPFTDPGGNTYFNQFAWNNFSSITIFKGPAGSMYGAGTGGLIMINTLDRWQPGSSIDYVTGSYHLQNVFASARWGKKENKNQVTYAHNATDGYRVQTKMRRDNISWESRLNLSDRQELHAALLYSDLYYQTPGALTANEYRSNPKAARPAAGSFPSAVAAKAAIFQKNITAGFSSIYHINTAWKNTTTLYGSFSQIKNPAVRNYERRNEPGYGGRTVFRFEKKKDENSFQFVAGSEMQQGFFNTQVAQNKLGHPDTLQTNDDIRYSTYSIFVQGDISLRDSWFFNGGISINKTRVAFTRRSDYPVQEQYRSYKNELAPRISVRKNFNNDLSIKATLSRGFSPPTVAELLPSTGVISTDLEAEYGWNYETGISYALFKRTLRLETTLFYFKLKNALVQRRDLSGADYFVNAGDVQEKGIESSASYTYSHFREFSILDYITADINYTYNHFRYGSFRKGTDDYSGKKVPSVPAQTVSVLLDINFKKGFYTNLTYYGASTIYLNDANTAVARPYHLGGARIGWTRSWVKKYKLNLYGGIDNLFDETYSMGNDINAAAGRYYNAAPPRNFYLGLSFQWFKS
ncbi:MAG: TonB-dependent receptor plug domain-containing protein [Terrimonas sp.]|nr:TonB-dependent receptor plug domain-containing protein [Terrimonas sp.]